MRVMEIKKPIDYLGKAIKVILKDGGAFNYKVTGYKVCGDNTRPLPVDEFLIGYDDEGLDITLNIADIDYILGGVSDGH